MTNNDKTTNNMMPGKWNQYVGMTHAVPMWLLPFWHRVMCSRGMHCFDEVAGYNDHDLCCDACQLVVEIANIDFTYVKVPIRNKRINNK